MKLAIPRVPLEMVSALLACSTAADHCESVSLIIRATN